MDEDGSRQQERQGLLTRLLDAVKQCQVRFGGRSELATDCDSRVSCLCATWEAALQHGMKKNKALTALRSMTERAVLGKMTDFFSEVKQMDTEPAFWQYVKEHLTKHEMDRFSSLNQIDTDVGRGRAWLRACLNEHSLERYMHMLIERDDLIKQYYHPWAFMCDQERNSMLPTMSAGLGSVLFAIAIDNAELNKAHPSKLQVGSGGEITVPGTTDDEPRAVIAKDTSPIVKRKEKKKKKKVANVVILDDSEHKPSGSASGSHRPNSRSVSHVDQRWSAANTHTSGLPISQTRDNWRAIPDNVEKNGFDVSSQGAHKVFQQQCSVTSATSILSAGSVDTVSNFSKSSAGSASLDGDLGSCYMVPVGNGLAGEASPLFQTIASPSSNIHSDNSSEVSLVSRGEVDNAVLALTAAQRGLSSARTDGDGGISTVMMEHTSQQMSHDELRQAVVAMMVRKDEVEQQNRSIHALLEQEMETTSMLRADIADLRHSVAQQHDNDTLQIDKLQKENNLLKHQLKKYVNAVQLLRTEGGAGNKEDGLGIRLDDSQPSIPPPKPAIDYSHEASEYEGKLIQVAEMHGELMEFNEMLQRQLNAKDAALKQIRQELVTLRGPLPYTEPESEAPSSSLIESLSIQGRTLINIWIPSAFLRGSSSDQHHVYQAYVRIGDEEWNVFRRYSQFLDLHSRLKKVYPIVSKFDFPAKKTVGYKEAKVVESRRVLFQQYLRRVINLLQEKNPDLCSNTCKSRLVALLPFFGEDPEVSGKKGRKKRHQQPLEQTQPVTSTTATQGSHSPQS